MKNMMLIWWLAGCLVISQIAVAIAEEQPIGSIKKVTGTAFIIRQGMTVPAQVGARLFQSDRLKTAKDGTLGVILRDNTVFAIDVNSEISLKGFSFDPQAKKKLELAMTISKGKCLLRAGLIAKQSAGSVRIETPVGTIEPRGEANLLVDIKEK